MIYDFPYSMFVSSIGYLERFSNTCYQRIPYNAAGVMWEAKNV